MSIGFIQSILGKFQSANDHVLEVKEWERLLRKNKLQLIKMTRCPDQALVVKAIQVLQAMLEVIGESDEDQTS